MKKRRLINLFLTSVMLLSSVLTPQMAHVVASMVNGENAEDTEQVNENDMPDVDAEDNVKEDDNTKAGDGGEEITDVTAEGETAEDEIEVITTDEADTGEPEKDGKETRGSPEVENVDESEADEEIVEDEEKMEDDSEKIESSAITSIFDTENLPKVNNTSKPLTISLFEIKDETDAGPYFSGNELVFRTTLGLTEESGSLSESVLEIRIPKDSNKILENSIRASDFNISQGPAEIDFSDPDAYIIRYSLNTISSGTTASVPIVFNTNVGYIPDGYNLPITASLLDTNGEELATSNTSVQFKTANLSMTKYVKNNSNSWISSNNQLINAGKEDPDNPGYLSKNIEDLKPIEFAYRINGPTSSNGRRYYNKFEVTDELPEGAIFIQDDNPGWVYDEENHRATFLVESNANSGAGLLLGNILQTSSNLPKLKLYFPGAKIDQPDTLTNNVNIISHPFEKGELESVQNTNDDITFRLNATPENTVPGTLSASKSRSNHTIVDVLSIKENHQYGWTLALSNQSNGIGHEPTDLENIVIDDHTLDEALYFNRLSIARRTISQFDGELSLKVTFDDGTSEIVSNNISITNGIFNADFNHYEKFVTAFEVRSNEGSILKPGNSIAVSAYSKFKDPESVTTPTPSTNKAMINSANFSANFLNGSTLTLTNRNATASLTPYNPRAYLTKSVQSGSQTYFLDDEIRYRLTLSMSNFYRDETMTDVVVLDLLPLGFEYVNNSTTGSLSSYFDFSSNNRNFPEPELIHNYQGTGRTALLWDLGNIISNKDSTKNTYSSYLNYKTRITDLALAGTHTNEAYFGWSNNDHITVSIRSNDDIFDINGNGSVTDKISKDMSNIQYAPPETLIVSKSVKGNLDSKYLLPPANANAEIGTEASYEINVFNNSPVDVNTLTLLDVLPHVGDTTVSGDLSGVPSIRGSEFPVTLTGPISLPEGYTVYYTSDEPSGDSVSYTTNANWSTSVSDFSMVKGIKIVLDESHILKKQEGFSFTIPIFIPKDESLVNNLQTVNSIGQSLNTQYIYTESNNATLKIVRYKVNGHVFQDLDKNGYYDETESPFANHIVTLVDEAGNVVTDLDGNPYSVKTDSNGYFEMDVFRQGNYRIKVENPKGHLVTILPDNQGGVPNHIIDDTSKTTDIFTLSPSNREANRNAGFYVETTSLEVTKVWKDNNNEFGNRPESITINVMANGDFYASYIIEGNEQDKWVKTITNLPLVNKNGEDVVYTLEEVSVNQYDSVIDNENYIITNTYNPSFISINVEKVWNDFGNQDGIRPSNVIVNVLNNNEVVTQAVLDESNNWAHTFTDLPKFENGEEIQYRVTENSVAHYSTDITTTSTADGLESVISNRYTPEETSVTVNKLWDDRNNQDGIRPNSIVVQLLANGDPEGDPVTLTAADNWTHTWDGLDLNAGGEEIQYTVKEIEAPGDYEVSINNQDRGNLMITNSYEPATIDIPVSKEWEDGDDQDGVRPDNVTVNLLANGEIERATILNADNDWQHTFNGLPVYANGNEITYTVTENSVAAYSTNIEEAPEAENGFVITNSYTPDQTSVTVTKAWDDSNNQDGNRPNSIFLQLNTVDGEELTTVGEPVEVFAADNWTYTWSGLDANADGEAIDYTVTEVGASEDYEVSVNDANHGNIIITNSYTPELTEVPVLKIWEDANDQDGERPSNITLNLLNDRSEIVRQAVVQAQEGNEWEYTFTNLPKYENGAEINYSVTENFVSDYSTEIEENEEGVQVVTNSYTPEETSVTVTKGWNDGSNQDGNRPDSIQVQLLADGEPHGEPVSLTAADGWTYTWNELDLNADGEPINYSVEELNVSEEYEVSVNDRDHGNILLTNHYDPEVIEIPVQKIWDDEENQDGIRPERVEVNLLADGEKVSEAHITEATDWQHVFTNLPRFNAGEEINYTLNENTVEHYSLTNNEFNEDTGRYELTNSYTPEETTVTVTKAWEDANNQDGNRPENIAVQLLANGETEGEPVELTAEEDWTYTWEGLALNAAGEPITYSVQELNVSENYDVHLNDDDHGNIMLTNHYDPELIEISGTKVWEDANNQDGIRPESITVHLLADGELVDTTTVTAADDWAFEFTEMPRFAEGEVGVEVDYTVEEAAIEDYEVAYEGYDITNSYTPEVIDITGSKTWDDADNQDGVRPQAITVRLLANGVEVDSVEVTEESDWTYEFKDIPKFENGQEIVYTVQEDAVKGYSTSIEGFEITNSHTPGQTSVNVVKSWNDVQDKDGIRPDSITVKLFANGKDTGQELVLSAKNNWQGDFTELDEYSDRELIEYTIEEVAVDGYESTITGTSEDGFVITNTHTPEEPETPVDPEDPEKPEEEKPGDTDPEDPADSDDDSDLPNAGEAATYTLLALVLVGLGFGLRYYGKRRTN